MQMVRDTLGEDAVIIATREEMGGRQVRVTAAVDNDLQTHQKANAPARQAQGDWVYDDDDDKLSVVEELTEVMLRHSVPDDVTEQIVSYSSAMGLEKPLEALQGAFDQLFAFRPLPMRRHDRPLMVVGPPGSGKTLAAAKIAARGVMNGLSVAVITTDVVRAGGVEQLEAFTRLLEIDLKQAETGKDLKERLMEVRGADQVIIDTAGVNPFEPENIRDLARLIGAGNIEPLMVLAAGSDADESGEMARVFSTVGAQTILPSRVDAARRLGGILSAAYQGGLAFADMSNTPKVADGLTPLSSRRLTSLLMPRSEGSIKNRRSIEGRKAG